MFHSSHHIALGVLLLSAAHDTAALELFASEAWPAFHNGGNTSVDVRHLPLHWSAEQGIAWNVGLPGYGQSAPVIWKDHVYVTAVAGDEKDICLVMAYDIHSGSQVWKRSFPATVTDTTSYMVSRGAPTPVVDARQLYVFFESGDLLALSHQGEVAWRSALFDGDQQRFQNTHGYGASPAQTAESIILLVDHHGPSYLTAISKQTGQPQWKTARTSRSSWSSPHVMQVGEAQQVVVSSSGTVDGYDVKTGRQLWSHVDVTGNLIPSATVQRDLIFVGASTSQRASGARTAAASNCCLRVAADAENGYQVLWQADRALCYYVSPLVHQDYVYYVNKVGVLYCLDANSGKQCYAERIDGPCWAQPIAAGDRLYFFGKDGATTVVRAGSKFERLATNRLWNPDTPPLPERTFEYEPEGPDDPRSRQPREEYLDPIVYGVAAVDAGFFVRLGTHLLRVSQVSHEPHREN